MTRMEIRQRYTQLKRSLTNRFLQIEEVMKEIECSENYARKLVHDLMLTGHVTEKKFKGPRGKPKGKFTWNGDKEVPTATPEKQTPPAKFKRTDPLIIALYGKA